MRVDKKRGRVQEVGPSGRVIGYARVSTIEQNLDMQIAALRRDGVTDDNLFVEKVSASSRRRPQFNFVIEHVLRPGDTLVVWKLDRLGRSVAQLLNTVQQLRDAGVFFRSITESINTAALDTPAGMMMFQMIAVAAEFERNVTRERSRKGVREAQERGVKFGQPPKLSNKQARQLQAWKAADPELSARELVSKIKAEFGITVAHTTVRNTLMRKIRN